MGTYTFLFKTFLPQMKKHGHTSQKMYLGKELS